MRQRLQQKQMTRAVAEVGVAIRREDKVPKEEGILLRLMLLDQKWVALARESLIPESFRHPATREVIEKLYEFFDSGREMNAAGLIEQLADERARRLVTATADDTEMLGDDEKRVFNDCLDRIKQAERKGKRERLRDEIRFAEKGGDHNRVLSLQKEFNQLSKE
jgi:vacuolar-type H+-ATPase subunit H